VGRSLKRAAGIRGRAAEAAATTTRSPPARTTGGSVRRGLRGAAPGSWKRYSSVLRQLLVVLVRESAEADFGPWLAPSFNPGTGMRLRPRVRDARPEGRDGAARAHRWTYRREPFARRWPGAVGNGGIVAYGARSPLWRPGARHARSRFCRISGVTRRARPWASPARVRRWGRCGRRG